MSRLKDSSTKLSQTNASLIDTSLPRAEITSGGEKLKFTDQLGPIITESDQSRINPNQKKLLIVFVLISAAILLYSGFKYLYGMLYYGFAAGAAWSRTGFLIGSLFSLFSIFLYFQIKLTRTAAYVHRNGISLVKAAQKPLLFTWRQLAGCSYYQEEFSFFFLKSNRLTAFLNPNNGKPVHLNKFVSGEKLPEFVTIIKSKLYPILEPELIKLFKSGQILYFGGISISKTGIKIVHDFYNWEMVDRIMIKNGFLHFFMKAAHPHPTKLLNVRISLKHVLNPELLLSMIPMVNIPENIKNNSA